MAQFIRGKQAGVNRDLSAGFSAGDISVLEHSRFGLKSKITDIAYNPVQSLLAVGTLRSDFDAGRVYIFGASRTQASFDASGPTADIKQVRFCGDKVVALDSSSALIVYSLSTRTTYKYTDASALTTIATDPGLHFVFLGHHNGSVFVYDLVKRRLAPFCVKDLSHELKRSYKTSPVQSITIHPRDLGTILVAFDHGIVLYSIPANSPIGSFSYDSINSGTGRSPSVTTATWHPTGTFIAIGYSNGSIVYWDPKGKRVVTVQHAEPAPDGAVPPVKQICWCAKTDPDDTALLIAGAPALGSSKGIVFSELGRTPVYATASWDTLTSHLRPSTPPKCLPIPGDMEVAKFCLIPRSSPHFAGCQNPIAIIALLTSGEVITMSFPSGFSISPTNQLPNALSFVHPFVQKISVSTVDSHEWAQRTENRKMGPKVVRGGIEAPSHGPMPKNSNIVHTYHADGSIRLWDGSNFSQIQNKSAVQVDVALAIGRLEDIQVTSTSLSYPSTELSVGLHSGEVVIFRWDSAEGHEARLAIANDGGSSSKLTPIAHCFDPNLDRGFFPLTLFKKNYGPVTALKHSDIGFVAAGFQNGNMVVIDMRGPSVIFDGAIPDLSPASKKSMSAFRGHRGSSSLGEGNTLIDPITVLEFSIMTCDNDGYSSILLHAGTGSGPQSPTKSGGVSTFKIVPGGKTYNVTFAGTVSCSDTVVSITGINLTTGGLAVASPSAMDGLRRSETVDGVLVVTTHTGARIFKPATSKGAHKTWDGSISCCSAGVIQCLTAPAGSPEPVLSSLLACIHRDGCVRTFSLPALKEVSVTPVGTILGAGNLSGSTVLHSGEVYGWTSPTEIVGFSLFGLQQRYAAPSHHLLNHALEIPDRPVISNAQWLSGTPYTTPSDLETLMYAEEIAAAQAAGQPAKYSGQQPGYLESLQNNIAARGGALSGLGDAMENLSNEAAQFATSVNKAVEKQKRNAVLGMFGL